MSELRYFYNKNDIGNIQEETPVEILQNTWEFKTLLYLFKLRKAKNILEIGVNYGGTLFHWLKNAEPGANITCVDLSFGDRREQFLGWVDSGIKLNFVEGDSRARETIKQVEKFGPFDWIFIDGDHYYDSIRDDWTNYEEMADVDATISIHDIVERPDVPWIEVDRMWREIQEMGYVTQELIADGKKDMGIGIIYL